MKADRRPVSCGRYEDRRRYLQKTAGIGLIEGTRLKLLNRKRNGSLIIYVRGTRLALGKHITSGIEVEEVEEDAER